MTQRWRCGHINSWRPRNTMWMRIKIENKRQNKTWKTTKWKWKLMLWYIVNWQQQNNNKYTSYMSFLFRLCVLLKFMSLLILERMLNLLYQQWSEVYRKRNNIKKILKISWELKTENKRRVWAGKIVSEINKNKTIRAREKVAEKLDKVLPV